MKEPNRIPLTNNPRSKEPKKLPLEKQYPEPIIDDLWDSVYTQHSPPILAKKNENNLENNSQSIQELESD
jgi:hypothetical protein